MSIGEIALLVAPLVVPVASAAAMLIPTFGNRRVIAVRLDMLERIIQMLILHDEHLPISERLNAGKRYIDLGGNGAMAAYYKKLEEKYAERVARHLEGGQ